MSYTIDEIKNKTIPIAKAYGISRMSLFGSNVRGEAKDDSDVDAVTTGIEDKQFLSAIMQEGCFCMMNEDILIIN